MTATLALFLALGGTSYAVIHLPANSVGSAQVRDHSLQPVDLANDVLAGMRGPRGAQGPTGLQGSTGPAGPIGPSDTYATNGGARVSLSSQPNVPVTAAQLKGLPAGQYLLLGNTDVANFQASAEVGCSIVVAGTTVGHDNTAAGTNAAYSVIATISETGVTTQSGSFDASLQCGADTGYAAPNTPFLENPTLTAVRVGAVTES